MKLGSTAAIALFTLLAGALAVTASPVGRRAAQPSNRPVANSSGTHATTLTGEVVQVQGDQFILRDATSELLVEAESAAIRQANLKAGDRVRVAGHYDDDGFEVFSITPANGTAIYVFDD
jgi:uncharacterized protein YdeI (BOF family)